MEAPAAPAGAFARDGFARLDGFAAATELDALRGEVERVLAAPLPPGCERPHNVLAPLAWGDGLVARMLGDDARMARLRRALGARDLRWISAYVSVKPPRSAPLWWHQDWWCWDHPVSLRRAAAQVAVLCYLGPTTPETGALRLIPGSHLRSIPLHAQLPEPHSDSAADLPEAHPALAEHPEQVTIVAEPGDAVAVDYRLLHGTHPNRLPRRRDCLVLSFAPDWAGLPAEVRAHLVRHPAQPRERVADGPAGSLLPRYDGEPRDLPLVRAAPAEFAASG